MKKSSIDRSEKYGTQLATCSIRARIAFVLALAEWCGTTIEIGQELAQQVRAALDLAWRWQRAADVSGLALYETVAGTTDLDDEDALIYHEPKADDPDLPAWHTIITAICYTSWHAYAAVGDKPGMPEPISNATEPEYVGLAMDSAQRVPGFNQAAVDRLAQYCVDHHTAANDKDLGEPISSETMMQIADWTIP